jgi:UDP-N-acetylglucosamine diphosphorylase/glucosamine-1-phosphate N-acetyltransferase
MRVCLFEDRTVSQFEPLTFTRPVFELLCGQTSLRTKQARFFGSSAVGALVRPVLVDYYAIQRPNTAVNEPGWLSEADGPLVLVNGRWLPPAGLFARPLQPGVGLVEDEVAYAIVDPASVGDLAFSTLEEILADLCGTLPRHDAGGRMMRHLWDLVHSNPEQLVADWRLLGGRPAWGGAHPPALVGPADRLVIDPSAKLDPMVVADTSNGPVILDRDVVVTAFSRLEGPCYLGPGTQVFGAKIRAGTTIGPQCRIGGEVECSVVQGYSNKYHDGFLGHSYVGEWVNLGAGTSNSDLRNDYGEVRVIVDGLSVRTGHTKVGCFLGDHTKAGLNVSLNTGSNIGLFCNLLPSGEFLPRYIPSFASWWNGELVDRAYPAQLFQTAEEVMRRRGVVLTEAHTALYLAVFEQTAVERRRVLREAERRQLRRSA